MKKLFSNILLFSIVPIISFLVSSWYMSVIDADFMQEIGVTAAEVCLLDDPEIRQICAESFYDVSLLRQSAIYTFVAAILLSLSFSIVARLCGTNREIIAAVFPKFVPLVLLSIAIIVSIQGAMLTYSTYWIQILIMDAWYPVLTGGIGLGAFLGSWSILKAIYGAFKSSEHIITNGKLITEKDSPKLFEKIRDIAASISAMPPKNVVLGLELNFYAINNRQIQL